MKTKIKIASVLLFIFFPLGCFATKENGGEKESGRKIQSVPGEIIVKYREDSVDLKNTPQRRAAGVDVPGMTVKDEIADMNLRLLVTDQNINEAINILETDPTVEYAEPNYKRYPMSVPNDPYFSSSQWGLDNIGQIVNGTQGTAYCEVNAIDAWDKESAPQQDVIVAVIDTGINLVHEDLAGNLWDGSSCKDDNNISIPGGCPNNGWHFGLDYDDSDTIDTEGHGTFIAGIIGAVSNNSKGVSGLSYHNNLKVMPVKFDFDVFSEAKAINFAKHNGAMVINASYGGEEPSDAERDAILAFPGVFVAAAGNDSRNNDTAPYYPASYSDPNVISVAATDQSDSLTWFSNYGYSSVDIAAPGENIFSTTIGSSNAYEFGNGTSFAAPFVSGTAGMLYSKFPSYSAEDVIEKIVSTGDPIASLSATITSGKRLNLSAAMDIDELPGQTSVYRFWSDAKQGHFYTTSAAEKNNIIATDPSWAYEGIAYSSYPSSAVGLSPIYRFWSEGKRHHFYTISRAEKDNIIASDPSWAYEGIAYYAFSGNSTGRTAIYRFWSNAKQGHFYTASVAERNHIIGNDSSWTYEGPAWYVPTN